jgi:S-adenosylmethionine synthetase
MFGYAIRDTPELMPLPIALAHRLSRRLTEVRKNGTLGYLRPDGKTQVTIQYEGTTPIRLDTVVLSTQHADDIDWKEQLHNDIRANVVEAVLKDLAHESLDTSDFRLLVNPTGKFVVGGPMGDAGLTGRKIIVDTYGGAAPHGGGAFSGKDPTKVDRSAAYAARYVAKNVVAAGLADRCTIQVSYAIGVSKPLSVYFDLHGTGRDIDEVKLAKVIDGLVNLSPRGIREHLHLNRPIYVPSSAYGHFGRTPDAEKGTFTWEKTDLVDELKRAFGR